MKEPSKIQRGLLIVALIPTILLLTPAGIVWGMAMQGGQFPMKGMFFGTIGGFASMLWATAFTVVAWRHQKWLQIKVALIAFLLIDFWWLPVALYQNHSNHPVSKKELTFRK